MSQNFDSTKPEAGVTTFGQLFQIIINHFAAAISRFSGTSFPADPITYQICWRSDRGTYGLAYCYTGNPAVGENGWIEDALLTTIGIEVIAARGSTASLMARLAVALNDDGTLKASTSLNPSQWATMAGHTFTYSNTTTFTVDGDQTAIYYPRRRIKATLTSGAIYSEVVSAVYSSVTTVVISDAVLDNTLTTVDHSLFSPTANGGAISAAMLGAAALAALNDFGDNIQKRANFQDFGIVTNALGSLGGGTHDIDLTLGNSISATVDTSATSFTFSNPTASDEMCVFALWLTNGGSQTITWPGAVTWVTGSAPALLASGLNILMFATINVGTNWYGAVYK